MKDLKPAIWLGLPLASFLFCVSVAVFGGPDIYLRWISRSESAYLEHSTVVMLIPAFIMAFWLFFHSKHFFGRGLRFWVLLWALGSFYFAGEEASWGQHYFHWHTPDWVAKVSDQGETNIHNTHGIFDQFPRGLLTAAAIAAFIFPFLLIPQRKKWDPQTRKLFWTWPTVASAPAGLLAALSGLPQKFYGKYGPPDPNIPEWFDSMFLGGKHNELMEHFLAMFILMYISSLTYRYWTLRKSLQNRKIEP
jgi:hypothetical protein